MGTFRERFENFRNRYKSSPKKPQTEKNETESEEKIAERLTLELKILVAVAIPLLRPCGERPNVVKVPKENRSAITNILNTDNKLIKENELYAEVKDFLQFILDNADIGIELNDNYYRNARMIERFCCAFQKEEYWEQKR